ncbi:MAG: methionyl-tRNA formyltransferase [Verrucomicrobiia bacterium]
MRTIFMGTAAFAVPSLEALINCHFIDLVALVTQPDKAAGRNLKIQPSAVKQVALSYNIPILQPEKARDENFINQLGELQPNLIIVAAYGQILPKSILDLPAYGCLNVHASLLPKYRGAAPIQWAIINGETETGVTIMKIDEGMDSGDIVAQRSTPITPEDTAETLHNRLAQIGSELLIETIPPYINGKIKPTPQDHTHATYAPKITKEHGHIDWSLPASAILNRIRAFIPWPGAYTFLEDGGKKQMLKIWEAAIENKSGNQPGAIIEVKKDSFTVCCGKDALKVLAIQPENGKLMKTSEYLAGHKLKVGQVFK